LLKYIKQWGSEYQIPEFKNLNSLCPEFKWYLPRTINEQIQLLSPNDCKKWNFNNRNEYCASKLIQWQIYTGKNEYLHTGVFLG
jgi:hypothetical protein